MGTIRAGNGTDPWTILQQHVKSLQAGALQRSKAADGVAVQQMRADNAAQIQDVRNSAAMERLAIQEAGRNARAGERNAIARERMNRSGSSAVGKKAINEFVNTLRENGLNNPYALAAAAAHVDAESSGNFGAFNEDDNGDGPSGGGLQWHDSIKDGSRRYSGLLEFAKKSGLSPDSPRAAALYFLQEGATSESKNFERLKNAKTLDEASSAMDSIQRYDTKKLPGESARRRQMTYAWGRSIAGEKPPTASEQRQQEQNNATQRTILANGDEVDSNDPHVYRRSGRGYRVFYPKASYIDQEVRRTRGAEVNEPWRYERAYDLQPDKNGNIAWRLWLEPPSSPDSNSPIQTAQQMGGGGEGGSKNLTDVKAPVKSADAASVTRVTGTIPKEEQQADDVEQDENE